MTASPRQGKWELAACPQLFHNGEIRPPHNCRDRASNSDASIQSPAHYQLRHRASRRCRCRSSYRTSMNSFSSQSAQVLVRVGAVSARKPSFKEQHCKKPPTWICPLYWRNPSKPGKRPCCVENCMQRIGLQVIMLITAKYLIHFNSVIQPSADSTEFNAWCFRLGPLTSKTQTWWIDVRLWDKFEKFCRVYIRIFKIYSQFDPLYWRIVVTALTAFDAWCFRLVPSCTDVIQCLMYALRVDEEVFVSTIIALNHETLKLSWPGHHKHP